MDEKILLISPKLRPGRREGGSHNFGKTSQDHICQVEKEKEIRYSFFIAIK